MTSALCPPIPRRPVSGVGSGALRAVAWASARIAANTWRSRRPADRFAIAAGLLLLGCLALLATAAAAGMATVASRDPALGIPLVSRVICSIFFLGCLLSAAVSAGRGSHFIGTLRDLPFTSAEIWLVTLGKIVSSPGVLLLSALYAGYAAGLASLPGLPLRHRAFIAIGACAFFTFSLVAAALLHTGLMGRFASRVQFAAAAMILLEAVGIQWPIVAGSLLPDRRTADLLSRLAAGRFAPVDCVAVMLLIVICAGLFSVGWRVARRMIEPRAHSAGFRSNATLARGGLNRALAAKEWRSLVRTGVGRLTLGMLIAFVAAAPFSRSVWFNDTRGLLRALEKPREQALALTILWTLSILGLAANSFGPDGRGVRLYRASGLSIVRVLRVKNTVLLVLIHAGAFAGLLFAGLVRTLLDGMFWIFLETFFALVFALFNWSSARFPQPSVLRKTSSSGNSAPAYAATLLFLIGAPGFLFLVRAVDRLERVPRPVSLGAMALAAASLYWASLRAADRRISGSFELFEARLLGRPDPGTAGGA